MATAMKIWGLAMAALACSWLDTSTAGKEDFKLDFNTNWQQYITKDDPSWRSRREVVKDPITGSGKVLQVTYKPSDRYGTQFDVHHFKNDPSQVCLTYYVLFPKDFQFKLGGKLPGLYGGATRCSKDRRDKCFSTRMMWREKGAGEVYIYLTKAAGEKSKNKLCNNASSKCRDKDGWSYKTGAVKFTPGKWNKVYQKVRMNTIGKADGKLRVTVDNKTITADGLTWRTKGDEITIRGLFFSTFFGGGDSTWAPSKQQKAYFKGISMETC